MTQFITVEELKAYPLPVKESMWEKITDDQIDMVIDYASQNIEDFCDRRFASAYYSEDLPGNNRSFLILDNRPIQLLQAVTSVDAHGNEVEYASSYFSVDSAAGMIRWVKEGYYAFSKGYRWVVEYRAGYDTIPGPVKHATALQAVSMLQPMFRGGTNFIEVDLIEGVNETIVDLLEKYKNKRIG
jgi:hypothetical protein